MGRKQALFNLEMAMQLPQITLDEIKVNKIDDSTYQISVQISNTGKLPVALKQAQLVKIVQEDRIQLHFDSELTKGFENAKITITEPSLYDKTVYLGYTEPGESKRATFRVTLNGVDGAKGTVKVLSTRGGYIEKEIEIGTIGSEE